MCTDCFVFVQHLKIEDGFQIFFLFKGELYIFAEIAQVILNKHDEVLFQKTDIFICKVSSNKVFSLRAHQYSTYISFYVFYILIECYYFFFCFYFVLF